ncbi:MAG: DUF1295 domain-containing protein [Candidatus Bathyarchaeia archaeon]
MKEKTETVFLAGLALVLAIVLTFITLELPLHLNNLIVKYIGIPDFNPAFFPNLIEEFIAMNNLRVIGYGCLAVVILLTIMGFVTERSKIASLGSVMLFLPTFGHFVSYMFFLAGIGLLRLLWIPLWSISLDNLRLGDVVYLPYMAVTYPLTLLFSLIKLDDNMPFYEFLSNSRVIHYHLGEMHPDVRVPFAVALVFSGLLIFVLGMTAWFTAHYRKKNVASSWLYRYTRHPQYLGWLLWSYGLMILGSNTPVVRGGANPGASLPWVLSSLTIVCVSLKEEIQMVKKAGEEYVNFRKNTPFLPSPLVLRDLAALPFRLCFKKTYPEDVKEVAAVFAIYCTIIILLSIPFVVSGWPSQTGWSNWPYMLWPFS